jgi:hypothetical protein
MEGNFPTLAARLLDPDEANALIIRKQAADRLEALEEALAEVVQRPSRRTGLKNGDRAAVSL